MTDYSKLPTHMQEGTRLYIEHGIATGAFFTALVSNDLMGAVGKADDINRHAIWDWCNFLHNEAPYYCFGSPEVVDAWKERGGTKGREETS
jgi:hypothetical protein